LVGGESLELQTNGADLHRQRRRLLRRKIGTGHRDQFEPQRIQLVRQILGKRPGRHPVESFLVGLQANGRQRETTPEGRISEGRSTARLASELSGDAAVISLDRDFPVRMLSSGKAERPTPDKGIWKAQDSGVSVYDAASSSSRETVSLSPVSSRISAVSVSR
jgi:hypothetical protein